MAKCDIMFYRWILDRQVNKNCLNMILCNTVKVVQFYLQQRQQFHEWFLLCNSNNLKLNTGEYIAVIYVAFFLYTLIKLLVLSKIVFTKML